MLKLGVEHEQVALLRKRLDIPSENPDGTPVIATQFDQEVAEAVSRLTRSWCSSRWRRWPRDETAPPAGPSPAAGAPPRSKRYSMYGALAVAARDLGVLRDGEHSEFMLRVAADDGPVRRHASSWRSHALACSLQ